MTKLKYYFIYRTTCLVTNKYYIGMHITLNLNDGYLGSGRRLRYSIAKHGAELHTREIVEYCSNAEELANREAEIVTDQALLDPLCMNLRAGGRGGFTREQQRQNAAKSNASQSVLRTTDSDWVAAKSRRMSTTLKSQYASGRSIQGAFGSQQSKMSERAKLPEALEKRKSTYAARGHSQGAKNSQYETCWITRNGENRKIRRQDLEVYCTDGWARGRTLRSSGD